MKTVHFEGAWSEFDFRYRYEALPKPQKTILKILYSDIIVEVFKTIDEIEAAKKDPNHEGQLRELVTTGTFQIPAITELASDGDPSGSRVVAGDARGNIFLLDVSRKVVSSRCEAFPAKRIQSLVVSSVDYIESKVIVIAVCALGSEQIKIFLANLAETKIVHYLTVKAGSQPYALMLSPDAVFLGVTTAAGTLEVHRLPYLPTSNTISQDRPLIVKELKSPITSPAPLSPSSSSSDIGRPPRIILASAITDALRATDLEARILTVPKPVGDPVEELKIPRPVNDDLGNDASALLAEPRRLPFLSFRRSDFVFRSERSQGVFPTLESRPYTSDVVVCWRGLQQVNIYRLLEGKIESVPPELTSRAANTKVMADYYANTGKYYHITQVTDPRKTINMLAPITCTACAPDCHTVALGLQSGAVIVLDLDSDTICAILAKHRGPVSCISYVLDNELVSGGTDGAVHYVSELSDSSTTTMYGTLTMNLRNSTARKPVVIVKTLPHRLALAIDTDGQARLYDLPNSIKLGKISSRPKLGVEGWKLRCVPKPIIVLQNQQLVVLSDEAPPLLVDDMFKMNPCELLVFRLPDILMSHFPGLANSYRREKLRAPDGRDPVLFLLEHIPVSQRMNPAYVFDKASGFADAANEHKKAVSTASRNTTFFVDSGMSEADSSNVSIYTQIPGKKDRSTDNLDHTSDLFSPPRIAILNPGHAALPSRRPSYHPGRVVSELLKTCEIGRAERAEKLHATVRKVLSEFESK